jgi:antitoxin component of MazEF toxin-antitoxin module
MYNNGGPVIKTLSRHGNSYALVIEKSILELLKIGPDTLLDISTDGISLRITPLIQTASHADVQAAASRSNEKHSAVFKELSK